MTTDLELPRFSTSEEVAFKSCRLAHLFKHDLGYAPVITNRKLSVGIAYHLGLETVYNGGTLEDALEALHKHAEERWHELEVGGLASDPMTRVDFIKDRDLLEVMVRGYFEWIAEEHLDDDWDLVSVEESMHIEVPGAPCTLPVKLDLIQRHRTTGKLRIVDHKTRASFSSDTTGYLLAEQTGNYALAVFATYGEAPAEVCFREARKVAPSARSKPPYFREVVVRITPEELVRRAEQYTATAHDRFDPDRAIYANPSGCCGSWKADWQAPCLKVAQGYTPLEALEASSKFAPHDPYARYQEETEE